jgi:hypothetical protein
MCLGNRARRRRQHRGSHFEEKRARGEDGPRRRVLGMRLRWDSIRRGEDALGEMSREQLAPRRREAGTNGG